MTKDKLPLAIHCSVPEKFWLALLKTADRLDLAEDKRFKSRDDRRQNYQALEKELASVFVKRTRGEWLKRLEANDVPAAPLYNIGEVLADPQVGHLELTEEVEHPKAGKLKFIGGPIRYEGLTAKKPAPPPLLGEQSAQILTELGYGENVIRELVARGIVKTVKNDERMGRKKS